MSDATVEQRAIAEARRAKALGETPPEAPDGATPTPATTPQVVMADSVVPGTGLLSAADILGAEDLTHRDVEIPEWTPGYVEGGDVEVRKIRIRTMSAEEGMKFAADQRNPALASEAMVRLVKVCAVDDDGKQLFSEAEMGALKKKSFAVFNRIQDVALVLNGFAEEVDEQLKNG